MRGGPRTSIGIEVHGGRAIVLIPCRLAHPRCAGHDVHDGGGRPEGGRGPRGPVRARGTPALPDGQGKHAALQGRPCGIVGGFLVPGVRTGSAVRRGSTSASPWTGKASSAHGARTGPRARGRRRPFRGCGRWPPSRGPAPSPPSPEGWRSELASSSSRTPPGLRNEGLLA